jgi:hypothetical protein
MLDEFAMAEGQRDRSNRLLGALEAVGRKRIDPHLEPIKLELGTVVCEAGGILEHALQLTKLLTTWTDCCFMAGTAQRGSRHL